MVLFVFVCACWCICTCISLLNPHSHSWICYHDFFFLGWSFSKFVVYPKIKLLSVDMDFLVLQAFAEAPFSLHNMEVCTWLSLTPFNDRTMPDHCWICTQESSILFFILYLYREIIFPATLCLMGTFFLQWLKDCVHVLHESYMGGVWVGH